ncbi:MAG TPA: hypothetical protein VGP68_07425 [Gemmataceae bacterium]|jgi:hypothetical protein|nr:hypothetical protein [Gemmataceae bacterium]
MGPTGTWQASFENGDKPGIGIELIRTKDGLSGWLFLLDPNKPHDFSTGSRRRMEIQKASDREIRFAVQWLPTQRDEMLLLLSSPLAGRSVSAELRSQDGQDEARTYEFIRIK